MRSKTYRTCAAAALLAFAPAARAYETDQLTWRERDLPDALGPANAEMDRLIDDAIERTNRATSCKADPERTHEVLAREIHQATAARRWVWSRGFWRAPGFGVYSKWMETDPDVARFAFSHREDLYGDLKLGESFILHVAGPCSTFEIAGVRVGSDKFDHFVANGFSYWKSSRDGADPDRAVIKGTSTENHVYGLSTSRVFSFGDLRANWDGFHFYDNLLGPGSVVTQGDDGCVQRVRGFDWSDYVDWHYDEVLYPPLYMPKVQEGVTRTLEERADTTCAALPEWAPEGWTALRDEHAIDTHAPWLDDEVLAPADPFALDKICAE